MKRFRMVLVAVSGAGIAAASLMTLGSTAKADNYGPKPSCASPKLLCTEIDDPTALGSYVGHDEPSQLFYSNVPGAGNHAQFSLTIPTEPSGPFSQTNGYNFELHPAFWFGMAMCDNFSYPETDSKCTPDTDNNIVNPLTAKKAPGAAFMELQFYPPGYVPQFADESCDATKWCVALNVDSFSRDPFTGKDLNPTCQSQILGGLEYINFAFLTLDGIPLGPPNPLEFNPSTSGNPFNPDTLFLNQGDKAVVTLSDTPAGFKAEVSDVSTGQTGIMVASAANHFGHIVYAPTGTSCTEVDYTFHPMFSTSSPQTRVLWAAHNYNVAFSDEIGHFDFCTHINANSPVGACNGYEGVPGDHEKADGDDNFCFAGVESLKYKANGCVGGNVPGFDGVPYNADYWPHGTSTTTTPIDFGAPLTGASFNTPYSQYAFETDLPRIEQPPSGGICNDSTGANCVNPPPTDDGGSAFYPYFSQLTDCTFVLGAAIPGVLNNFGGSSAAEYGTAPYGIAHWINGGHGAAAVVFRDFNSGPLANSCTPS